MVYKRVDANQSEIVKAFREAGASVFITSSIGNGFPDLIVGIKGKNYLFEVKDGSKCPSQAKLTPMETIFFQTWSGQAGLVKSSQQASDFVKTVLDKENASQSVL